MLTTPLFPTREYHADGTLPGLDRVLVFGSNLEGRHGKGAALIAAKYFGAQEGQGRGLQGQAYAIATRMMQNKWIVTRPLCDVVAEIELFVEFTKQNADREYFVTAVGCGNAGFEPAAIAKHFREAINCSFPSGWKQYLDLADQYVWKTNTKSM